MDTSRRLTEDDALGLVFGISGLVSLALSFMVFNVDGRPILFGVSLAICLLCLAFTNNKTGILLGCAAFIALRLLVAFAFRLAMMVRS